MGGVVVGVDDEFLWLVLKKKKKMARGRYECSENGGEVLSWGYLESGGNRSAEGTDNRGISATGTGSSLYATQGRRVFEHTDTI